jgi:hypothetical protein
MNLATGAFVAGTAAAVLGALVAAMPVVQAYATGSPRLDKVMATLAILAAVAAALSWFLADRLLAPRRLSPSARRRLVAALSRNPSSIDFDFVSANRETTDLALALLGVLRDAGWVVDNHGGRPPVGRMPEGLAVVVPVGFPVPESAAVLCRALTAAGLVTTLTATRQREFANSVRLRIFPKPS